MALMGQQAPLSPRIANYQMEVALDVEGKKLNGKTLERNYITYEEIIQGGLLEFEMTTLDWSKLIEIKNIPNENIRKQMLEQSNTINSLLEGFDKNEDEGKENEIKGGKLKNKIRLT